jgi:hypothetical protein
MDTHQPVISIPPWVLFAVAAWVILFGLYRLRLAFRKPPAEDDPNYHQKGLFAGNPRRHFLFGVVYLILGTYLILAGLGKNPALGGCASEAAARDN